MTVSISDDDGWVVLGTPPGESALLGARQITELKARLDDAWVEATARQAGHR